MIRGLFAASAVVAGMFAVSAQAADLAIIVDDVPMVEEGFDWEGLYIGGQLVGEWLLSDEAEVSYFGAGATLGMNFLAAESFLIGIEGVADVITNDDLTIGSVFALGRAGALVTPDLLLYGIAGVGYEADVEDFGDGVGAYQLGAGLEFAVTESVSLRGQLTGLGYFEDGDEFFDWGKATVGVSFYF